MENQIAAYGIDWNDLMVNDVKEYEIFLAYEKLQKTVEFFQKSLTKESVPAKLKE